MITKFHHKPKARHNWEMIPRIRIATSKKTNVRSDERKKVHEIVRRIDWFGEGA